MNQITKDFSIFLWEFNVLFGVVVLPFTILGILRIFTNVEWGLNYEVIRIKSFFPLLISDYNIKFLSKEIRKINVRSIIESSIISLLIILATWIIANSIAYLKIWEINYNEIEILGILFPMLLGIIFIFSYLFTIFIALILVKKELKEDILNEELLKTYEFFINDWINKYGNKIINFYCLIDNVKTDINPLNLKNIALQRSKLKRGRWYYDNKYSKIDLFRIALINIENSFKKLFKDTKNHYTYFSDDDKLLTTMELKMILIHNYIIRSEKNQDFD